MDFRINSLIDIHDVDFNGIAKTSSILKYIQSAAQSQLTENGMSYEYLKANKKAFILSRLRLEVSKPLRAYTPITAITYPCESRGYSFLRCYSLESDGEIVAKAISVWALIDTDNRSLIKVNDFSLGLPTLPPLDLSINHIKLPSNLAEVGKYGVHYGDVDQNYHMNNTKYPDMYSNFLPLKDKFISSVSINYLNEAQIGEKLSVMRTEDNGIYYFSTIRGDKKVNSEAQIVLSDIV